MTNYTVKNLNDKTSEAQRSKLQTSLMAIDGVDKVTVHPAKSEISLAFSWMQQPKKEVIEGVVAKAGFTLGPQL